MIQNVIKDPFSKAFAKAFGVSFFISILLSLLSWFVKYVCVDAIHRGVPYSFWVLHVGYEEPWYYPMGFFLCVLWWHTRIILCWAILYFMRLLKENNLRSFFSQTFYKETSEKVLSFVGQIVLACLLSTILGAAGYLILNFRYTIIPFINDSVFATSLFIQSFGYLKALFCLFLVNLVFIRLFLNWFSSRRENLERYFVFWLLFTHLIILLPTVWSWGIFENLKEIFFFWPKTN